MHAKLRTYAFGCAAAVVLASPLVLAKPYKGAEVYAKQNTTYGKIEMRMRMARGSGVLSTFFLYKDGSEKGGAFWEEVDLEVFGKNDAKTWQSNIITGNPRGMSEQVHTHDFSLADGYHTFVVEWAPGSVRWLVDGEQVRFSEGGQASQLTNPESVRFNIWAGTDEGWVGPFDDAVLPQYQFVNWVKFYRYENGAFVLDWTDDFDAFDEGRWGKANWTFDVNRVDFDPYNVVVQDGTLVLALTKEGATGFAGEVPLDEAGPAPEAAGGTGNVPDGNGPDGNVPTGGAAAQGAGGASPTTAPGTAAGGAGSAGSGSDDGCSCSVAPVPQSKAYAAIATIGLAGLLLGRRRRS